MALGSSGFSQDCAAKPPGGGEVKSLDPQAAFRLFHTGLLTESLWQERSRKSGRGPSRNVPLRSWEYLTESDLRGTRPPGELLDEAERGARAIRATDPGCIHAKVLERMDGIAYHVEGCYHRRVQILTFALRGGQLSFESVEKRKQLERKLLECMEQVRKERAFGHYLCKSCGSRWRSGFTYEEMAQECLKCGSMVKPFRIAELEVQGARPAPFCKVSGSVGTERRVVAGAMIEGSRARQELGAMPRRGEQSPQKGMRLPPPKVGFRTPFGNQDRSWTAGSGGWTQRDWSVWQGWGSADSWGSTAHAGWLG